MKKLIIKIMFLFIPVFLVAGIVILVDPYFHYHKPIKGLSYVIDDARRQNYGILEHFDYDAIITGTSIDENAKASEVDSIFGVNSIKVPYSGGFFPEIAYGLRQSYRTGHNPKMIMMSLCNNYFVADKNYWGNEQFDYPYYLYDDNIINDWHYLFSERIWGLTINNLISTIKGVPATNFDEYTNWAKTSIFGRESMLKTYERPETLPENGLTKEEESTLRDNISFNIISLAKSHNNTIFYLYFPPYSVVYWDEIRRKGEFDKVLTEMKLVIEELINVENIKLFYFSDDTEITSNLDNYRDSIHYAEWINSYMIKAMSKGDNLLTKGNYMEYLKKTEEFYGNYNYEQLFD